MWNGIRSSLGVFLILLLTQPVWGQQELTTAQYVTDFHIFWQSVKDNYAYFHRKQTDWDEVREIYLPRARQVRSNREFIALLENAIDELYDPHAHLNVNTPSSWKLVPSGLMLWAEWRNGKAIVLDARNSRLSPSIKAGMEIITINGIDVEEAVRRRMGKSLRKIDEEVRNWALRSLLAGRHNETLNIRVRMNGSDQIIHPKPATEDNTKLLHYEELESGIGYIRIHNSLGQQTLVESFDEALESLRHTKGLILDLRNTPGGGNSSVARGMMSRFITKEMPYQKHELPAEELQTGIQRIWMEFVAPRGPFSYTAPIVVLVSYWTGSMGEGIAIGLDGMGRAKVVGTEMAKLLGATYTKTLPASKIGVNIPFERLYHINGTPREEFVPSIYIRPLEKITSDTILEAGTAEIKKQLGLAK